MMNHLDPDDEFAELDTTEEEIDAMMASGQEVIVVSSSFLASMIVPENWVAVFGESISTGGATAVAALPVQIGASFQIGTGIVDQMVGAA